MHSGCRLGPAISARLRWNSDGCQTMASSSKLLCQIHELFRGAAFEFGIKAGGWYGNRYGAEFRSPNRASETYHTKLIFISCDGVSSSTGARNIGSNLAFLCQSRGGELRSCCFGKILRQRPFWQGRENSFARCHAVQRLALADVDCIAKRLFTWFSNLGYHVPTVEYHQRTCFIKFKSQGADQDFCHCKERGRPGGTREARQTGARDILPAFAR